MGDTISVVGESTDLKDNHLVGSSDSMDLSLSALWELVMVRGAWHAAVYGVTKSRTRLCD